ncbi:MAG TPA: alpha/beta hydrolase, partial [Gemmataceae bacterium]|nr:alpha/beta hydrolase [Gemmataceae bacterium]
MPRFRSAMTAVFLMGLLVRAAGAAEPDAGSFDADGVKIHYTVQGTGEPVVLVHGLLASGWLNWDLPGVTGRLEKGYRVIAIDLPGHGGSDKPDKPEAYGTQMVEDVLLLMDHLKIKKAHVVGYSLGGIITTKLLTLHPDRVRSATVGGVGWVRDKGRNLGLREHMPVRDRNDTFGLVVSSIGKLAITEEELKAIKLPVEVIVGDQDVLKRASVEPLRKVRPDWPVVEIKNAGHMSCIVKKEFAEA